MSSNDVPKLLNVNEAAERLGVSVSFLNKARLHGDGPPYLKIASRVAYAPADLATWLDGRRRNSTSETGGLPS